MPLLGRLWQLVAIAVLLAGCIVDRPQNAVALSIYARNLSAEAFSFTVVGSHEQRMHGEAGTQEPRSYGCGWVGRDWRLIVVEGDEAPDPADPFVSETSGADHGNPPELAVWIDVDANGRVTVGDGVPAWWTEEIQRCP